MKNTLRAKLIAGATVLGLGMSLAGTAFAGDLNWSNDQIIDLASPDVDLTIQATSEADSLIVNTGNIQVVVAIGDVFTVTVADMLLEATGQTTSTVATECSSGVGSLEITGGGADETITVTASGTCTTSGGGGGGGGGSSSPADDDEEETPAPAPAGAHGPGSVILTSDGTVWFITGDFTRRPFTSAGAFLSYNFTFSEVVAASAADLTLAAGSFIPPRDGSIFCATETKGSDVKGECALITNGQKAAFVSEPVFTGLGFSFGWANYGDSSFLTKTANITSASEAHRTGVLVNNSGTVQLVGNNGLMGIPSMAVFNSWRYNLAHVVLVNTADKQKSETGVMSSRVSGQLNP